MPKIAKAVEPTFDGGGNAAIYGGGERIAATVEVAIYGDAEALTELKLQEASVGLEKIASVKQMVVLVLLAHHVDVGEREIDGKVRGVFGG